MNASQKKVVQYLGEAHASEQALVRVLQSQIAMTPRGAYRTALEQHLRQTRDHAERVGERLQELGHGGDPLTAAFDVVETVVGQALALTKTPFDLLRGSGGEEKVLKNAKDAYASEAMEIATYTAIERLAGAVGDEQTAKLAASIRADEEKMLERVLTRDPQAHRRRRARRRQGQPVLRRHHDGRRRRGPRRRRGRQGRGTHDQRHAPSAPRARPARCRASRRPKARSRAPSRPRATWRSPATTRSPRRRSSAGWPSSPRSTWPRSTPTSARTRTAPRSSAASPRCAATSRGPAMTS